MGKASRWMKSFLLGRKEKAKKKQTFPEETFKKRWSFGTKLGSKESVHRSSRFLDSIAAASLVAAATRATSARVVRNDAATRIQVVFRSYLARKALRALRSLVKLQALVRGHLVRKQMEATLRRMHALMEIQLRTRFRRIEMAESSRLVLKSHLFRYGGLFLEKSFRKDNKEVIDINLFEKREDRKNSKRFMNHTGAERIRHEFTRNRSEDLSASRRRECQEQIFSATAHSSPLNSLAGLQSACGRGSFNCQRQGCPGLPSYMLDTESSKGKARSQSEQKQRPRWSIKGREQLQLIK